jgi:hypothetical protein
MAECDTGGLDYTIPTGGDYQSDTYIRLNDCTGCVGGFAEVASFPASLTGGEC